MHRHGSHLQGTQDQPCSYLLRPFQQVLLVNLIIFVPCWLLSTCSVASCIIVASDKKRSKGTEGANTNYSGYTRPFALGCRESLSLSTPLTRRASMRAERYSEMQKLGSTIILMQACIVYSTFPDWVHAGSIGTKLSDDDHRKMHTVRLESLLVAAIITGLTL